MKLTRRKFLKGLATALGALGIAPAALLKSADKQPFDEWREDTVDLANQKGVTIGTRIISYRPVIFNSKDYGIVVVKTNNEWRSISEARKPRS